MYTPHNYESLLGLKGFSDNALKIHFKLYEGYVTNVNRLLDELTALHKEGTTDIPHYAELKRRFGWEFNGMRLHELYFGAMTKRRNALDESSELAQKLAQDFGSVVAWQEDFTATAKMRGIGWAILYFDPVAQKLLNVWINEHDVGHLAGGTPLIPLDVFEHAYIIDYGTNRQGYIEVFLSAINWQEVASRFETRA